MSKGFLYVAHGKRYLKEVCVSAESFKKHCPDASITLFTNEEFSSPFIDSVKIIKARSIRAKVYCMYDSPYDETCFLDSDVVADYKISDMFDIFPKYDMGGVHDLARKRDKYANSIPEYGEVPYAVSEINTGILLFKKAPVVEEFFKTWQKLHSKYYKSCPYDQPSFRATMWKSDVNFCSLPIEYNIRSIQNRAKQIKFHHEFGDDHLTPRIYHMHHGGKNLKDALKHCKENFQEY